MQTSQSRVALVCWRLGSELERLIELDAADVRYVVVSADLRADLRDRVEWHRIPLPAYPSFRLRWLVFWVLGTRRIGQVRADLVHTIGPTPIVSCDVDLNTVTFCHAGHMAATSRPGVKGTSIGWRVGQQLALRLEQRWFTRRVRVLGALTPSSGEELRRFYPGVPVVLTPRGLDLGRFRRDESARRSFREARRLMPHEVVAVFVDQDHRPLKGLEIAIRAFVQARESAASLAQLWVLGSGSGHYRTLAENLGVGSSVRFLDYRSDIERFYQAADVFVLPTAYETFCRSAHEAAACGLPVVATEVSGIRDLIGANEAGFAVRREAGEIARALAELARDAALRVRMGEAACERAAAFGIDSSARQIAAVHRQLLAGGLPPIMRPSARGSSGLS